MYAKMIFIIIKLIANKPLNPSIKLAPLITNKKQRSTNIEENIWLDINVVKNGISIFRIFSGKMYMEEKRRIIIFSFFNAFYHLLILCFSGYLSHNSNTHSIDYLHILHLDIF